jgi:hypothetical protein
MSIAAAASRSTATVNKIIYVGPSYRITEAIFVAFKLHSDWLPWLEA